MGLTKKTQKERTNKPNNYHGRFAEKLQILGVDCIYNLGICDPVPAQTHEADRLSKTTTTSEFIS